MELFQALPRDVPHYREFCPDDVSTDGPGYDHDARVHVADDEDRGKDEDVYSEDVVGGRQAEDRGTLASSNVGHGEETQNVGFPKLWFPVFHLFIAANHQQRAHTPQHEDAENDPEGVDFEEDDKD